MHGVDLFYKLFINLLPVNKMVNAIFVSVCCTLIRYMALFIFILAFPAICLCAEWIQIVGRERKDDFYKPAKNSVICSDHSDKSDISANTNRHRLAKTAVIKLQVHLIIVTLNNR